jgi:acetyltransferase-like isoleucine patch superfamily enzyme
MSEYAAGDKNMMVPKNAQIHPSVVFGEGVVLEEHVVIGENCRIGHRVIIHEGTVLKNGVIIGDQTVLGKLPYKASNSAVTNEKPLPPLCLESETVVGALCVVYRGALLHSRVFVGDLASIREEVEIGEETIIGKGVSIENRTSIGRRCKIETNAYITAISVIGDDCFIAPEVTFTNDNYLGRTEERKKHFRGVTLKRGARIGANATVLPGITIGEDALLAAGSVLTKDIPPATVYLGVPARYFGDVPEEQLLVHQQSYIEDNRYKAEEGGYHAERKNRS